VLDLNLTGVFQQFGRPTRLRTLAGLVRSQPASAALDARIALEMGWLQPYSELREDGKLVTGVISGDFRERYPLYGSWFKHARQNWWDDGSIICNRVPNLPRYTSDVGIALATIPDAAAVRPCRMIVQRKELWTVEVYGPDNAQLLGSCAPGEDSLAKTFVLAGIDCRIRQSEEGHTMH